jgi:protein TonB
MPSMAEPLPSPPRLTRRRADREDGRQTRDRLSTMLILAALVHGLVILGVSFTSPGDAGGQVDRGLEILLVSDELAEAERNDTATYLAQRTQTGSGNSTERLPAELPSEAAAGRGETAAQQQRDGTLADQVVASSRAGRTPIQIHSVPVLEEAEATPGEDAQRSLDDELRLRGERRDELYVTADTRASKLAPYLDGWRRRVERIGTLNYPTVAQQRGAAGNPVVEVVIRRDGNLGSVRIQRSSGRPEIDEAALQILKLASPFDPFPPELAREYRSLRFAYEWQFEGGRAPRSAVTLP